MAVIQTLVEGVAGVYHYHLSRDGRRALCDPGLVVMPTRVPASTWGTRTHLRETYCAACGKKRPQELRTR